MIHDNQLRNTDSIAKYISNFIEYELHDQKHDKSNNNTIYLQHVLSNKMYLQFLISNALEAYKGGANE